MAEPHNLDAVSTTGATFGGAPAKGIVIILEDDRRVRIDLPIPVAGKKWTDWTKTKSGKAILTTLADIGGRMKGATLAKATGYSFSGSFRQCLKDLTIAGEITHDEANGYSIADE